MAVEGKERTAPVSCAGLVFDDDVWSVVEWRVVVVKRVNLAGERRVDRDAGVYEQIDSKMNSAMFVKRTRASGKRGRCVQEPCFIVTTDTYTNVRGFHQAKQPLC